MAPRYAKGYVNLILKLAVLLMFGFPTSSTKQCTPQKTERDSNVIRNIGIKLCQLKCTENGECLSVDYNAETLTCRLLRAEPKETKKKEGHVILARDDSQVPTGSCTSSLCSFGQRCLNTRSGKNVCVQDEKQYGREESLQHKVDKQDTFANSPLHEACRKGELKKVRDILSQGLVDINSREEKHGRTPLMVAAQEGHCRVFDCLIRKGANKSDVDNDCKNVLHWACKGGHVGTVECVLPQYGIEVNEKLPFIQAAYGGNTDVLKFLECTGSNVSQVDPRGNSALHIAADHVNMAMVKYLVSQGSIDINSRSNHGMTPLILAAQQKADDLVEFLLRMGANASIVNNYDNDAMHHAILHGHLAMVKCLVSQGRVDINSRNTHGRTSLMFAALECNGNIFDYLMRLGASASLVNVKGENILHYASKGGCEEMVKHILSQNLVDINSRNKDGETAAMIAKRKGKMKVYDFLVSRGCPVQ